MGSSSSRGALINRAQMCNQSIRACEDAKANLAPHVSDPKHPAALKMADQTLSCCAFDVGDADASMGGTVQGRIAQNLGIGLGSCRRCTIAIRQWLRAAHNCGSPHTITRTAIR